jgi:hypothetical protein
MPTSSDAPYSWTIDAVTVSLARSLMLPHSTTADFKPVNQPLVA